MRAATAFPPRSASLRQHGRPCLLCVDRGAAHIFNLCPHHGRDLRPVDADALRSQSSHTANHPGWPVEAQLPDINDLWLPGNREEPVVGPLPPGQATAGPAHDGRARRHIRPAATVITDRNKTRM